MILSSVIQKHLKIIWNIMEEISFRQIAKQITSNNLE